MQKLKMNSRIIAIFGILCSMIGLTLMADWQSIPHDPCADFSLYYHPEVENYLSGSLEPCLTSPSDCQWPPNSGSIRNMSAVENKLNKSVLQHVEMPDLIVHTQGRNLVLNASVYNVAMNACESLTESPLHCHWIPKSVLTGKLCEACPAICRATGHTLILLVHHWCTYLSNFSSYFNNCKYDCALRCCQQRLSGGLDSYCCVS